MRVWRSVALAAVLFMAVLTSFGVSPAGAQEGSLSVSADNGAEVGGVVEVTVGSPASAAAVEMAFSFDSEALEFAGAFFEHQVEVLAVDGDNGVVDAGAFRCSTDLCDGGLSAPVGAMRLRFVVLKAGTHKIASGRGLAVAANGSVVASSASQELTIVAGNGETTSGVGVATLGTERSSNASENSDVTDDGRIDKADVLETATAWDSVRRVDGPCVLDDWASGFDVDGSGCLDIADLVAVSAAIGGQVPADDGAARRLAPEVQAAAANAPFVVNSTADSSDNNLNDGICASSSGVCTLRAAIQQANSSAGPNEIHFNIPGSGVRRISLGSPLPGMIDNTGGTTIDGYTQPGSRVNTSELVFNGKINVEVYGRGETRAQSGMVIYGPNNTVRGLAIYNSFFNLHLSGNGATNNNIVGNIIGTNAGTTWQQSSSGRKDQAGIEIRSGASQNQVGTVALKDRNVISGNPYAGVRINHSETVGNRIQNNLVGFTANGTGSLYSFVAGIDVQYGAQDTLIGGYQEHAGNKVVNNTNYGIDLSHESKNNIVVGNRLGTDPSGTRVYSYTDNLIGLAIKDGAVGNTIEHNVAGGNRWHGVWHRHNFTGPNTFRNNWIGIGLDGSNIGNLQDGIDITGHDDTYSGNVIAYNRTNGVNLTNFNGGNGFSPPEYTESNRLTDNSFFSNSGAAITMSGGVQNNVAPPTISSASQGSASGSACSGCQVELYVADGDEGRQFIASTTANGSGNWSISDAAIKNVYLRALATTSNNDTSVFSGRRLVGSIGGNTGPTLSPVPDQASGDGQWLGVTPSVSDPDGDYLTFNAIGLPNNVSIDRRTGLISGRPAETGTYKITVAVDDGRSFKTTSFRWVVGGGANPSTLSGTITYSDGNSAGGVGIDLFSEGRADYLRSASTDGSGNYQFDVGPGCYVLTYVAPSGSSFDTGPYKNESLCVGANANTDADQVLTLDGAASGAVGGTVLNEGGAARSGIAVDLFEADSNGVRQGYLRSTTTGSDGTYQFDLSVGGCYAITFIASGNDVFTNGTRWAQRSVCLTQGESNLAQDATIVGGGQGGGQGTIEGAISKADGSAAPATTVDLFAANADGSRASWLTSTTSSGSGNYSFSREGGCYVLVYIAPNGYDWPNGTQYLQRAQCVAAGQTTDIDVALG